MTEPNASTHQMTDGLWRWLVGGLAGGGIILGLLIAAYAVGYHRGQHHGRAAAAPAAAPTTTARASTSTATTTTPSATAPSSPSGPVPVTAALVAHGKTLYQSDGCAACHSLTGGAGAGPSFKALAGSSTDLTTGQTVTADDAYLARSITDPDAQIVKGYRAGVMPAAIASYDLAKKPADVRALVAFIKSQK